MKAPSFELGKNLSESERQRLMSASAKQRGEGDPIRTRRELLNLIYKDSGGDSGRIGYLMRTLWPELEKQVLAEKQPQQDDAKHRRAELRADKRETKIREQELKERKVIDAANLARESYELSPEGDVLAPRPNINQEGVS
ncbi:MAG: hypothetical protein RLZZ26_236 [Candidatus Parcubacteria bacterium]|jgi:hypothetical protein